MSCKISVLSVIEFSKTFEWNVEDVLEITQDFEWNAGEGPLYWWRVEFRPGACPPQECTSDISDCTFSDPQDMPCCEISCPPDNCISTNIEIWNVLATSPEHLCERLTESCNRRPSGFIKKLQKYQRPALCCDVQRLEAQGMDIVDEFEDVDFLSICQCASFIDPCDQIIEFPCISTEVVSNVYCSPPMVDLGAGFAAEAFTVEPKNVSTFANKYLPEVLTLEHNLSELNILKSFLIRNNLDIKPELKLLYDKNLVSWQHTVNLKGKDENWQLIFDVGHYNVGDEVTWKINFHAIKSNIKKIASKVLINFTANDSREFFANVNLNTKSGNLSGMSILSVNSKLIQDEIGIFKKDPVFKIRISK